MANSEEKDLEQYLSGKSGLSWLYRKNSTESTSVELDKKILAAARRAGSQPLHAHSPFARSWYVPVSLAAVFIASVTVTFLAPQQPNLPIPHAESVPSASGELSLSKDEVKNRVPSTTPNQLEARVNEKGSVSLKATTPESPREQNAPGNTDFIKEKTEGTAPIQSSGTTTARSDAALKPNASDLSKSAPAPAVATEPGKMVSQEHEVDRQTLADKKEKSPSRIESKKTLAPEIWLERIEELRKQGKIQEAEESLLEFRKRYPDYPIQKRQ